MDAKLFREQLDFWIKESPELFPAEITRGYYLQQMYLSNKLDIYIRQIEVGKEYYTVHLSFVMPYLSGKVDDVESALFLRKFNVPFWALSYLFGKDAMYWYRLEQGLGRMSIVGTTIRNPEDLPEHLDVDEKHTWIEGEKVYIATTTGGDCILGVAIAQNGGADAHTH